MTIKFIHGKAPATKDARDLSFATYAQTVKGQLPQPKDRDNFGFEQSVAQWGMLGNDNAGDCVWAGAAHETLLWNAMGQHGLPPFTDAAVLSDYSAVTGYNPADPATDQGTIVRDALNYRRKTGIVDAAGARHKIGAYVALKTTRWDVFTSALYLFGAVAIGIRFPSTAMDQFNAGKPWTYLKGSHIEGGHYVPVMGVRKGNPVCVTWGKLQPMTREFYRQYVDEAYVLLSQEMLDGQGRAPTGFDIAALRKDLAAL